MILIFGFGIWFWTLVVLEFILLTWFVEQEWPAPSVLSVAVFVVLLWWLADIPIWTWIKENPKLLALYVLYYIIAGIIWSFIKFYFALNRMRGIVKDLKKNWKQDASQDQPTFKDYLSRQYPYKAMDVNPENEGTISKLIFWSAFWPVSLFWTILNDPIRKFFKWLVKDVFAGVYKKMYQRMVGNLIEE